MDMDGGSAQGHVAAAAVGLQPSLSVGGQLLSVGGQLLSVGGQPLSVGGQPLSVGGQLMVAGLKRGRL